MLRVVGTPHARKRFCSARIRSGMSHGDFDVADRFGINAHLNNNNNKKVHNMLAHFRADLTTLLYCKCGIEESGSLGSCFVFVFV